MNALLTHTLESAWFQPLNLKCDISWFEAFAFKFNALCRYAAAVGGVCHMVVRGREKIKRLKAEFLAQGVDLTHVDSRIDSLMYLKVRRGGWVGEGIIYTLYGYIYTLYGYIYTL